MSCRNMRKKELGSCSSFQNPGSYNKQPPPSFVPQQPYCYVDHPPFRWRSFDQFRMQHSIPLPPMLPPIHQPNHLSYSGPSLPPAEPCLRRWEKVNSLHATHSSSSRNPSNRFKQSRRVSSRGEIGSMQELPQAPFVPHQPQKWHYSCRDLALSNTSSLVCVFCKSNREPPEVYSSHQLKDANGMVTCPILRNYHCKYCGATGNFAHTDSYCPRNPNRGVHSSMKSVLKTRIMSSGKIRTESSP